MMYILYSAHSACVKVGRCRCNPSFYGMLETTPSVVKPATNGTFKGCRMTNFINLSDEMSQVLMLQISPNVPMSKGWLEIDTIASGILGIFKSKGGKHHCCCCPQCIFCKQAARTKPARRYLYTDHVSAIHTSFQNQNTLRCFV